MAVTMSDVAKYVGVDKSTVSLVLNDCPSGLRISQETRKKVLAAAVELNYRPSFSARSLRKGRTFTLGLVCGGIESPFNSELAAIAIQETQARGYHLLVSVTEWGKEKELACLEMLREGRVEGVLMLTQALTPEVKQYDQILQEQFPLVLHHAIPGLSSVSSDWRAGMDQAVKHLKAKGYTRVGYIWLSEDTFSNKAKHTAFLEACINHGVEHTEYVCSGLLRDARDQGRALARDSEIPKAFIVCSDFIATGIIRGLADEGVLVPRDVAVVGIDGTGMGEFATPALTTIAQDCRQLIVESIRLLQKKIENREAGPEEILLPTRLIVRESA